MPGTHAAGVVYYQTPPHADEAVFWGNAACGRLHLIRLVSLATFPSRGRRFYCRQPKSLPLEGKVGRAAPRMRCSRPQTALSPALLLSRETAVAFKRHRRHRARALPGARYPFYFSSFFFSELVVQLFNKEERRRRRHAGISHHQCVYARRQL